MSLYKYDMLLFCKQLQKNRCLVYCVELETLDDPVPKVHCFCVSLRQFIGLDLGRVYRFEVRGTHIIHLFLEETFDLSEADYELLQELRFRRFEASSRSEPFSMPNYFTYQELCCLLDYREPLLYRFSLFLLRSVFYVLAGLIPVVLYTLLVYVCFSDQTRVYSGLIIALGALPFMIFMVILLNTVAEIALMEWRRTRSGLLRSFALRRCGAKHRMGIKKETAKKLVYIGAATFFVFVVTGIAAIL